MVHSLIDLPGLCIPNKFHSLIQWIIPTTTSFSDHTLL
uniref:Uncharacterized protein n=1 Tax=Rhizophora mucronata TaxID=61149 RepID=A0A2P2N7Z5_RHIMU